MRYLVSCECNQQIPVTPGKAGQQVPCSCGRIVSVPMLRELRALPVESSVGGRRDAVGTTVAAESPQTNARGWNPARTVWFLAFVATLLSLAAAGVLATARSQLHIAWTYEAQSQADAEVIDNLAIDQVLSAWVEFQKQGLGEPNPDHHMFDKSDHAALTGWIRRLLLIAIPFGLITLGLSTRALRKQT